MVIVNGCKYYDIDNLALSRFLSDHGYKTSIVAVECNKEIVPKKKYEDTILKNGDVLEVVSFVGGG